MKFKCNNTNIDVVEGILDKYGVSKSELLHPSSKYKTGYCNIDKAADRIIKAINNEEVVGILVDDDCDGFTSSAVMYDYLDKFNEGSTKASIVVFFHEGKQHGLNDKVIENIKESGLDLLIIPDASSSDENFEKIKDLDVVILDHHLFEVDLPENVIRVNNQDSNNKDADINLTGVGMVYRALQIMDKKLGVNYANDDLDLVALGQIGDSSDYSEQEVRWIVNEGLKNMSNKLILTMLKDRLSRGEEVTGRDCSFEVIPYINAIARVGSFEEKASLFNGLTQDKELDKTHMKKRRRKDRKTGKFRMVEEKTNGYESLFKEIANVKKKQTRMVEKAISNDIERVESKGGIIIAIGNKRIPKGLTGLITAKLTSKFGRPAILVSPEKENYTGSIRGKDGILGSLKDWCDDTNLFNWVQGHDNAAGCQLKQENIDKLVNETHKVKASDELEVDYLGKDIDINIIEEIYRNRRYFGGKVQYPKVGIQNKRFLRHNAQMRGDKTMCLQSNGVDYIIFNVSQEVKDMFFKGFSKYVDVDIYGEPGVNNWMGRAVPQVIVNRIELAQKDDEDFDF